MAQTVSNLISVSVNRAITAAQGQNLATMLILGSSDVIDVSSRYRTYSTLAAVATDFGTSAPEYLAAAMWFGQSPAPAQLLIGQWAKTAVAGRLICGTLSAANQVMSVWQAFTAAKFRIKVNGGTLTEITCGTFANASNLNGIATIINTALTAATIPAAFTWNASFKRFEIKSTTTGTASVVDFLSAGTSNDIAALLAGLSTSQGVYKADGIAAETAISAVTLFDAKWGRKWYSIALLGGVDADYLAIAAYVQASNTLHAQAVTTQDATVLNVGETTSLGYNLNNAGYSKSPCVYSSSNPYAMISVFARIQTTDYTAENSVINLAWKQLPGVIGEDLNQTQMGALDSKNVNYYTKVDNDTTIFWDGSCPGGFWMDDIFGTDALAIALQTSDFNILYQSQTKIPQTDKGMNVFVAGKTAVCQQFVRNGFLAPGVWGLTGFGTLKQNDLLTEGFYIYAPPIASQSAADRGARKTVSFQIAAKLAGGVNTVITIVNINQ